MFETYVAQARRRVVSESSGQEPARASLTDFLVNRDEKLAASGLSRIDASDASFADFVADNTLKTSSEVLTDRGELLKVCLFLFLLVFLFCFLW